MHHLQQKAYQNPNSTKNKLFSSKGQSVSSTDKINQLLKQMGKSHLLLNHTQNTQDQLTLRKNTSTSSHLNNNAHNNVNKHSSNKQNNSLSELNSLKIEQINKLNSLNGNNNNPSKCNLIKILKQIGNKKQNTHNQQPNNPNKHQQSQFGNNKIQQLKHRFNKIKNNYDAHHQNLKNDLIVDSKQLDSLMVDSRENSRNSANDNNNDLIQEFLINEEELTFSRSREYGHGYENYGDLYSFVECREEMLGQSANVNKNNYKNIIKNHYLNASQVHDINMQKIKEFQSSLSSQRSNTRVSKKYQSLSKQLKTVKHNQLIQILLQQIQDNQKNKHVIQQYESSLNNLRVEIEIKGQQNFKIKKDLQEKRSQIEVLLVMEKKNLDLIEKLKNQGNKDYNASIFKMGTAQKQKLIEKQKMYEKQRKLQKQRLGEKQKQFQKELRMEKDKLLEKERFLEKQIRAQKQRLLQRQRVLQAKVRELSQQLQQKQKQNKNIHTASQPAVTILKPSLPKPTLQQTQQAGQWKQKHNELQKYMNQYINNVNQAYQQYLHKISQLKQSNFFLNKQVQQLTNKLRNSINSSSEMKNQNHELKQNIKKTNHALNNSRNVIKELETEFLLVKDENEKLKGLLDKSEEKLISAEEKYQNMKYNLVSLNNEVCQLKKENQELNAQLHEIQQKIIQNNQIEEQVKLMFNLMNDQKSKLQQKQLQLKTQVTTNLQTICQLNNKIKSLEQQMSRKQTIIKEITFQTQSRKKSYQIKIKQILEKQEILLQQCEILEETNKELQKLQEDLLQEYENEKSMNQRLKTELMSIVTQVKEMQSIYGKQVSTNQLIKKELESFWVNKLNSVSMNSLGVKSQSKQNISNGNDIKAIKPSKKRGSVGSINNRSKENSQKQSERDQNTNQRDSYQISFKKGSLMTKQGSSSFFKNQSSFGQGIHNSKQQDQQRYGVFPSVQGSIISEKYFSQSDSQCPRELKILQSTKKGYRIDEFLKSQLKSNNQKQK